MIKKLAFIMAAMSVTACVSKTPAPETLAISPTAANAPFKVTEIELNTEADAVGALDAEVAEYINAQDCQETLLEDDFSNMPVMRASDGGPCDFPSSGSPEGSREILENAERKVEAGLKRAFNRNFQGPRDAKAVVNLSSISSGRLTTSLVANMIARGILEGEVRILDAATGSAITPLGTFRLRPESNGVLGASDTDILTSMGDQAVIEYCLDQGFQCR